MISGAIALQVYRLNFVLESHHSTRPVAEALLARVSPEDRVVHEGSLDYSAGLPFYTGRQVLVLGGARGALHFGARYPEARHLFLEDAELFRLWRGKGRVFLVTGLLGRESVVEKLPRHRVFLIGKYGARRLYTNVRPEAPHTSAK